MKTRSTRSRCGRLRMRSQSRHSERAVRTKRSAIAFAFGARTGVLMISMPSLRKTGVEVARVLAVAIADKEAKRRRSVSQCPGELAGLLGDPGAVWVGGAAGEVYAPAAELDEEEHVEPLQPDGFDGEEVDRDHALGLRSQELAPTEARALAGRSEASLAKQVAHRRRRYRDAEPAELTGDPLVAPAPVLPGEPKNQVPDLAADRRAADPTGIPPALRDQPTVPSKERRRSDDKRAPARSRHQPAGRGKEHPINGFQLGATGLTPAHRQLVAEHHDFQLLELLGAKTQRPKLQKASEHDVTERPEQDRLLQDDGTGRRLYESDSSRPTRNRVNAPHRPDSPDQPTQRTLRVARLARKRTADADPVRVRRLPDDAQAPTRREATRRAAGRARPSLTTAPGASRAHASTAVSRARSRAPRPELQLLPEVTRIRKGDPFGERWSSGRIRVHTERRSGKCHTEKRAGLRRAPQQSHRREARRGTLPVELLLPPLDPSIVVSP